MRHTYFRKGIAVCCAVLLLGTIACTSEDGTGKVPTELETQKTVAEEKKEQTTEHKTGTEEEMQVPEVTTAPEVNISVEDAIAAVKEGSATVSEIRTAVVTLADSGIEISGTGCVADGTRLKIKEAGVYEISGSLSDGSIYVNADNESEVHLILNGVTVHNETSAALYCKKAKKVTITLADGSVNKLSDGESYVFEEGADEPDAALYAKHDLVINGSGKLEVTSAYGDAVKGKDSLYILGGELSVKSAEDGIVGRDLLYVADGTLTVDATADALKASNDTDTALGNMVIDGGSFILIAGTDGMQAENMLNVNGGSFVIKTGGGSAKATVKTENWGFGGGNGRGQWGDWGTQTEEEETVSAKGLKAGVLLSVTGGNFKLDTLEDAIHGNTNVTISGGEFEIAAGDDGVHADEVLHIKGNSKFLITKSYEGLEALEIVIDGGEFKITASDDGLNAAGGADGSGFGGGGRMGMFGEGEGEVTINGGTLLVNADGDGLDSNGNFTMNGGTVTVFGPTGGGNGVLDFGGTFALNGGVLLAAGTSSMSQTPSDISAQYSLAAVLDTRAKAGSTVEIAIDGKTVISGTVPKQFDYIVASSKEFVKNAQASIVVNGEELYAGMLTDVATCFGFSGGMGGFGGFGGFGGNGGDKGGFGGRGGNDEFGGGMPQMPEGEMPEFPQGERPQMPEGERSMSPRTERQS